VWPARQLQRYLRAAAWPEQTSNQHTQIRYEVRPSNPCRSASTSLIAPNASLSLQQTDLLWTTSGFPILPFGEPGPFFFVPKPRTGRISSTAAIGLQKTTYSYVYIESDPSNHPLVHSSTHRPLPPGPGGLASQGSPLSCLAQRWRLPSTGTSRCLKSKLRSVHVLGRDAANIGRPGPSPTPYLQVQQQHLAPDNRPWQAWMHHHHTKDLLEPWSPVPLAPSQQLPSVHCRTEGVRNWVLCRSPSSRLHRAPPRGRAFNPFCMTVLLWNIQPSVVSSEHRHRLCLSARCKRTLAVLASWSEILLGLP
jgi:hypothetical protein